MGKQSRLRAQNHRHKSQDDEIAKLRAENAKLRRDLERRNMWVYASDAGAAAIDREIEKLQIKCEELQKRYDDLLGFSQKVNEKEVTRHLIAEGQLRQQLQAKAPMRAITPPKVLTDDQNENEGLHQQFSRPFELGKSCYYEYSVGIRFGRNASEYKLFHGDGIFPGTIEDATIEVGAYVDSALRRAPFLHEIKQYGTVNREVLHEAMLRLAIHYGDDLASRHLDSAFEDVFENLILPEATKHNETEHSARANFSRIVADSFKEMYKQNRGIKKNRKRKTGPKTKVTL